MSKKFSIRRELNGVVLKGQDGEVLYSDSVVESEEIANFVEFLRTINEHYGPSTSRYSKERIQITIVQGDKYAD